MKKKTGLNLNDTIHYNKWDKYVVLIADNPDAVVLRAAFGTEAVYFVQSVVVDIAKVAERANRDLSGITAEKELALVTGSKAMGDITSNVVSFASKYNMTALKKQMKNATAAKLGKEKDENFVAKCAAINTSLAAVITDNPVTSLAYFTAGEIADAMVLVGEFDSKLGVWSVAEADVNNAKIEFELVWMPLMKTSLEDMEGMLPGAIRNTYPAFAASFIKLKKLVRSGVKEQGVLPTMEDSETGELFIYNGKMETMNYVPEQKSQMTNSLGLFDVMKLTIGIWKIKFSAPGYDDQTIEVRVDAKKVTKLAVKLVKTVEVVVVPPLEPVA